MFVYFAIQSSVINSIYLKELILSYQVPPALLRMFVPLAAAAKIVTDKVGTSIHLPACLVSPFACLVCACNLHSCFVELNYFAKNMP
jgi:hypothetical protein